MNLHRIRAIVAAAGLAVLSSPYAVASGFTGQDGALLEAEAARAPLALSGDGAWRLHVDSHDVLHRASLAQPGRESTLQLPPGVRVLSASNDGLKVALSTDHQCIGLVDFAADAPKLAWRPWVVNAEGTAIGSETTGWTPQLPANCGDRAFIAPVAISSDGRLVATAEAVVDAATNRVVASLPAVQGHVLRLQFVDHDARLLIASATMGERWEAPAQPSSLGFSVWDLASKALVNDIEIGATPLVVNTAMQVGFSPQTGALFYVDERRRDRAQRSAKPGETPVPLPLDLVQVAPGVCGSAPRTRAAIGDDVGADFVVDPYGRWFASSRPLDAAHDAAELATGARSVLVVQDMASGRQLERVTSKYALTGLVATPDGATLLALASQPREPETGELVAAWPVVPDDEQVLQVRLPDAATTATRDPAKAWERDVCKESGEAPGARAMARSEHALKPLWSRDLSADAQANASSELKNCGDASPSTSLFKAADGGLWLDLATHVAKLDPLTGKTGDGLPTPRTKNVCSVVTPTGSGFLNAGGDTLTWRPLAAATDPAKRRVVDHRAGWSASFAQPQLADAVRVLWLASPRAAVDHDAFGNPQNLLVVDYDASGKRLRQFSTSEDAYEEGAGDPDPVPAPCHDARGTPLAIGYDWRAGPFGSQRGMTCGPLPGMARLVWWSGASIAPRLDNSETTPRAQPAIDGAIAVVADDSRLHVVNLALQREFAQIDMSNVNDGRAWVLASRRLVLVEATGADQHRWLRAYALP